MECYAVLGIKREMPTEHNDYCGENTPILPNGTLLNTFGFKSKDAPLVLESSLELMGDEGKFLIGYQLAYLDHHDAESAPRAYDPEVRAQLINELKEAGMQIEDDDVKLYIHLDSEDFQH